MPRPNQEVRLAPEECVPNIGVGGIRRRRRGAAVFTVLTLAVFAEATREHAPWGIFLLVAPFAALAAVYFFQAKEKT